MKKDNPLRWGILGIILVIMIICGIPFWKDLRLDTNYSWQGIYKATVYEKMNGAGYEKKSIRLQINEQEEQMRISLASKVTYGGNNSFGVTVNTVVDNETLVDKEDSNKVIFFMKAGKAEESETIYVELLQVTSDIISIHYANSEEALENEEFIELEKQNTHVGE